MAEIKNNEDFLKASFKELLYQFIETDLSGVEHYSDTLKEITIKFSNQQCKKLNETLLREIANLKNDFNHKEKKYKEQLNILNSFLEQKRHSNPCVEIRLPSPSPASKLVKQKIPSQIELSLRGYMQKELDDLRREEKKREIERMKPSMDWDEFGDIMEDMDSR